MARATDKVIPDPRPGFERIHNEYCKLVEDPTNGLPYQGGAYLTPSDIAAMKISFDLKASSHFWQRADDSTRCALEEIFTEIESLLNEINVCKEILIESQCPTIEDAYTPSDQYSRILQHLVREGLFYNEALVDSSGNDLFCDLRYVFVPL